MGFVFENLKNWGEMIHKSNTLHMCLQQMEDFLILDNIKYIHLMLSSETILKNITQLLESLLTKKNLKLV